MVIPTYIIILIAALGNVHGRLNASWKICSLAVNGQSFLVIDGYLLNSQTKKMLVSGLAFTILIAGAEGIFLRTLQREWISFPTIRRSMV